MGGKLALLIALYYDNQAAISVAKNKVINDKKRHVCLIHKVVKDLLENGTISLGYVESERNLVDLLTKGFCKKIITHMSKAIE